MRYRKLLWTHISWSNSDNRFKRDDSVVSIEYNNTEINVIIERFAAWRNHVVVYVAPLIPCPIPAWCTSTFSSYLLHTDNFIVIPHTQLRNVRWAKTSAGVFYVCNRALHV
eukprot:Pompholyxophrys_sp_v1_NODE_88_length_2142_cov_5.228079.p3 type:complete len:111 gc:universal NODE_88_length_2142_cov_5.228079:427-95(-)